MAAFPDYFLIDNIEVISNIPTVASESQSLITYVRLRNAQRWDINLDCRTKPWDTKKAFAFQNSLKAGSVVNEFTLPVFGESAASDTTALTAEAIGATTIEVSNVTDVEIGDYVGFAGHTKVYLITDINVNELTFFPNLTSAVAISEGVTFNPEFTVRLSNIPRFRSASARQPQTFTFNFVEAL